MNQNDENQRDTEANVCREVREALQKSEQKYRAIFDHAYSGICLMEVETAKILDINRAECAICGFDAPHTVIGERKCVLLGEYPFSAAEYWQHFSAACAGAPTPTLTVHGERPCR